MPLGRGFGGGYGGPIRDDLGAPGTRRLPGLANFGQPPLQLGSEVEQQAARAAFGGLFGEPNAPTGGSIESVAEEIMNMNQASAPVAAPKRAPAPTPTRQSSPTPILPAPNAFSTFPVSDPIVAEPAAPVIPTATSDAAYQQQMADLARAMADYENQLNLENSQYNNQYNDSLNTLGWRGDPTSGGFAWDDRGTYAGQVLNNNQEDFAGRGLLNSGLYEVSKKGIVDDFTKRKTGFDTSRQDFLSAQTNKKNTFANQRQSSETQALMEAIARIAAQHQIDPNLVPKGI